MPRGKSSPRYKYAIDTAHVGRGAGRLLVHKGTIWHAECPTVLNNPSLFADEPLVVYPLKWVPPVEQATAAPGEERDTGRG